MANFYDSWLGFWDESNANKKASRAAIHEEDLEWVETDQDSRVALLAAPENGFATWGSEYMIGEINPGWHTGKHEHGEEAIYILEGEGFSIVNGTRYEWGKDSCLWMPFGSQHQHFNTGTNVVRYFSAMALHVEHWMGMGKLDQISVKGPTDNYEDAEVSTSGFDALNRRIVLTNEDTETILGGELTPEELENMTGEATAYEQADPTNRSARVGHRDFIRPLDGPYRGRTASRTRKSKSAIPWEMTWGTTAGSTPTWKRCFTSSRARATQRWGTKKCRGRRAA